jgi:hypothetical protein
MAERLTVVGRSDNPSWCVLLDGNVLVAFYGAGAQHLAYQAKNHLIELLGFRARTRLPIAGRRKAFSERVKIAVLRRSDMRLPFLVSIAAVALIVVGRVVRKVLNRAIRS